MKYEISNKQYGMTQISELNSLISYCLFHIAVTEGSS